MFTKSTFKIMKNDGGCVLCPWSSDKWYLLEFEISFHVLKANFTNLWHKLLAPELRRFYQTY